MVWNKKLARIIISVIMVLVAMTGCDNQAGVKFQSNNEPYDVIKSTYVEWSIPSGCMEYLRYETEANDAVTSDMFYMVLGGQEIPIFRFDFGDESAGDWLGLLTVGEEKIPVVYTVFMVSDEELAATENGAETYYMLMDLFNNMLNNLTAGSNFKTERPLQVGEDTNMNLTYWTVTLPNMMKVSENTADGNYEAVFSAEVVGEMVPLYRVCIGELQAESFLGYFEIGGVKQPVSVEAFELAERGDWSEDDYAAAYRMMDTINDVLQAIRQDKNFSEQTEPAAYGDGEA